MMSNTPKIHGGCLCKGVRYSLSELPYSAEYCHCNMCQKSVGAVTVNWMDLKKNQLTWITQKPFEYQSSQNIYRGFCRHCGCSISFRDIRKPENITLTIASLDEPNLVKPKLHIYTDDQVDWLSIDDECIRFSAEQTK